VLPLLVIDHTSPPPPDYRNILLTTCTCFRLPEILVERGLFPASPSQPRVAISIELLEFYRALFERSCDAIHALAGALSSFYVRRGFQLVSEKVSDTQHCARCII
jgi:hypothetical protein